MISLRGTNSLVRNITIHTALTACKQRGYLAPTSKKHYSETLEKGLRILHLFNEAHNGFSLTEISKRTGINKTSVYRYVNTYEDLGYLRKDPRTKMIRLGPRTTALAHAFLQGSDLVECVKPLVDEAHLRYGAHVDVGLLHGQCIYLVYRRESKETMAFRHFTKARKMHYLATGKAAFAFLPREKQEELLAEMTLDKKTGRTITDKAELLAELALTRKRGYSLNNEEYIPGLIALGAPLKSPHSNQILGGLSFDFSTSIISLPQMEKKYAKIVVELAKTVSAVIPKT